MKKFLALVLTLAMVLTLNVGMIAGAAADEHIDVTGQTTVTVDEVTYTVIDDLSAVATKGNYILSKDVEVAEDAVITFAAGTVLNGNGYTISVAENELANPAFAAPFALTAGEAIVISNVKFGSVDAPICLQSEAALVDGESAKDIGLFANDYIPELSVDFDEDGNEIVSEIIPDADTFEGVVATFTDVDFAVAIADELMVNVGGFMGRAFGTYTFENCSMACELEVGDMSAENGTDLTEGYAGGYFGQIAECGMVSMTACETVVGSEIINDWRTGGLIGGVAGGVSLVDSVNNATVSNITLATGGLIGWVEGETLSAWTLEGCVNNGDITAYMGPKTSAGKNHGDAGRTAGGLVGYIYKDTDNTAPQIIVSDCVNNGNVYGEDRLAGLMGDNRIAYGEITGEVEYTVPALDNQGNQAYTKNEETGENVPSTETGKTVYIAKPAIYENCVNTGDVKCIVKDAASGAHVMGGITSRPQGPMQFINCVNYGTVDANGQRDGHLGGIVGNTSAAGKIYKSTVALNDDGTVKLENDNVVVNGNTGCLVFENCVNYGALLNGRRLGGINGTGETVCVFTNCVNFGTVNNGFYVEGGHTDNYAGGITGFADNALQTYTDCLNAGTVKGLVSAGGIIGFVRGNKVSKVYMDGCVNVGNVISTTTTSGGLVGESKAAITIVDSMNAGFVSNEDQDFAAQIIGDAAAGLTVGNLYMYGTFDEENLAGDLEGMVNFMSGVTIENLVLADGYNVAAKVIAEATADAMFVPVTADQALADIAANENLGAGAPLYNIDGAIKFVYPQIKGVQAALEVVEGNVAIRVTGIVDDLGYDKVGYVYAVAAPEAENVTPSAAVAAPMEDIKATNVSGNEEVRTIDVLGGAAIQTVTINVPAEGEFVVAAYMKAYSAGNVYYSNTVYVSVVDGAIVAAYAY